MRTTEMVLIALFLKTSKFLPAIVSIYILSLITVITGNRSLEFLSRVKLSGPSLYCIARTFGK